MGKRKKIIIGKHITNITYQDFHDIYYYITYPNVKPYLYGINTYGDIINLKRHKIRIRKYELDREGYARTSLMLYDNSRKHFMISRLVAWEFVGHPENYNELQVNHADGIHINNFYKNLEWVTNAENCVHKAIYGLAASRERQGSVKHTEKVVRDVIRKMQKGYDAPHIARFILNKYPEIYDKPDTDYDRLRGLVSKISTGASWYSLKLEMEGSTTIENIIYEKHIGEEVSRVGLDPIPVRKNGQFIFVNRK